MKQGVVWKNIKMQIFGIRPDEIDEKIYFIKRKQYDMVRPVSSNSDKSLKSPRVDPTKLPKIEKKSENPDTIRN